LYFSIRAIKNKKRIIMKPNLIKLK